MTEVSLITDGCQQTLWTSMHTTESSTGRLSTNSSSSFPARIPNQLKFQWLHLSLSGKVNARQISKLVLLFVFSAQFLSKVKSSGSSQARVQIAAAVSQCLSSCLLSCRCIIACPWNTIFEVHHSLSMFEDWLYSYQESTPQPTDTSVYLEDRPAMRFVFHSTISICWYTWSIYIQSLNIYFGSS